MRWWHWPRKLGLTREQLSCELRFLELRGVITGAPAVGSPRSAADDTRSGARYRGGARRRPDGRAWRRCLTDRRRSSLGRPRRPDVASAQMPAGRLPAPPSPTESFRRWVKQKLVGYPSVVLAAEDEQGLVGVGAHRYHLAEILAMDVVRDVATQRDMRLERDLDGASCHSTVGGSSQYSADEPGAPEFDQKDPRQVERREAFRSYLRRTLAQLPHGIVTFKTHRRLVEAGALFHGVAPQWIKPTILEVASEMGSRFTTQEQAVAHVSGLVAELVAEGTAIDSVTRAQVYAEGTRWGLDPMDVEAILRRYVEHSQRLAALQQRRRRRLATLIGEALLCIVVGLLWLALCPADG